METSTYAACHQAGTGFCIYGDDHEAKFKDVRVYKKSLERLHRGAGDRHDDINDFRTIFLEYYPGIMQSFYGRRLVISVRTQRNDSMSPPSIW